MSNSVQPHRRQPTRLPHPWDSLGKNTGLGCHFLLQRVKAKSEIEVAQSCPIQQPHGLQPNRLLRPWDSLGKSSGVGCHCFLQLNTLLLLLLSRSVVSDSVRPHRRQPNRLPHPWDSQGKNTGVGCHCLLLLLLSPHVSLTVAPFLGAPRR